MALLYGRAGRLTAKNGGFRPGQVEAIKRTNALLDNNISLRNGVPLAPVCRRAP